MWIPIDSFLFRILKGKLEQWGLKLKLENSECELQSTKMETHRPCFGPQDWHVLVSARKWRKSIHSTWCSTNVVGGSSFLEEGIYKLFLGGGDSLLNTYILYIFQGRTLTWAMTFLHFWWPQTPGPVRPRLVGRAGDVCHDAGQHWCCVVGSQNQRWMPQFPLSSGCLSWALARLSWARLFKRFSSSHRVPCVVQNARAWLKLRVFFQQLHGGFLKWKKPKSPEVSRLKWTNGLND